MQLARIPWRGDGDPNTEAALRRALEDEGFRVLAWSDPPGARYAPHAHAHDESLWCLAGEITFGAGDQSLRLGPGDRLMLPRGTVHSAVVGPAGASYLIGER